MTGKMNPLLPLALSGLLLLGGCGASYTGGQTSAVLPPSPTPTPTPVITRTLTDAAPSKEETVYVNADALGKPEKIEVEAILSGHASGEIPDVSTLKDIRNTEGDETFTANGTSLIWENKGADIHYKGTADASSSLPVTETVTFFLNGREIAPEDLAGQSGRVKIRFDFENHTAEKVDLVRKTTRSEENEDKDKPAGADDSKNPGEPDAETDGKVEPDAGDDSENPGEPDAKTDRVNTPDAGDDSKNPGESDAETDGKVEPDGGDKKTESSETVTYEAVPVPFTVITMVVLPEEGFSNVEIENGRLLTMDDSNIAIGLTLPGLEDFLTAGGAELTEDLKVPDYVEIEADATDFKLSFTASIISAGLLDEADLSSLEDLAELRGDMVSLTEATSDITEALREMEDGTADFSDGIEAYTDGVSKLSDGLSELSSGAKALKTNTGALTEGAKVLAQGLAELKTSLPAFPSLPDIDTSGLEAASQSLLKDLGTLTESLDTLAKGDDAIEKMTAALTAAAAQSKEAAQVLALYEENKDTLLTALSGSSKTLTSAAETLSEAAKTAGAAAQAAAAQQIEAAAAEALSTADLSDEEKAALARAIAENAVISGAVSEAVAESQTDLAEALAEAQAAISGAQASLDLADRGADAEALSTLAESLQALTEKLDAEALGRLQADAKALSKAFADSGLPELMASIDKSVEKSGKTAKGLDSLAASLKDLEKNYKALRDGVSGLSDGSAQLSFGLGQFADGISQLADGVSVIESGSRELSSHGDELKDGTAEISEAIGEFREGFEEFSQDGLTPLTDFVNEDLSDLADRLKAIQTSDGRCETWSGLAPGTKGTVRFILETAEI